MRKLLLMIIVAIVFAVPVGAVEIQPVTGPAEAEQLLPDTLGSFWADLGYVIKSGLAQVMPNLRDSFQLCWQIFVASMILSILHYFEGISQKAVQCCAAGIIACLLLGSSGTMIDLAEETVSSLSDYSKLLLPVMTTALAAQGGISSSAGLYAGATLFNTVLTVAMTVLLIPLLYIYIALSVVNAAISESSLEKLADMCKRIMIWMLRMFLYLFVGYIGITGVVSGATDQMTLKATKQTISGAVPVVGNILSDASEALLVSIGVMKNTAGIYGIFVIFAIFILPFLRIGAQYLLLKLTGILCQITGSKACVTVVDHFAFAMGFLLSMTAAVCVIQLISIICFMRGIQI